MAKKTVVTVTDDLDGSRDATTVTFGFDGTTYEIDLGKRNKRAMESALQPYLDVARKVRSAPTRRRSAGRGRAGSRDLGAVRAWAAENGFQVSDRGRIPTAVIEAFDAAH